MDDKTHVCVICGYENVKVQSPQKPYKVWKGNCYCQCEERTCFVNNVGTLVRSFYAGKPFYGGYEGENDVAIPYLRLLHDVWKKLVEVDRNGRIKYRLLTTDPVLDDQIVALETEMKELRATIKKGNSVKRTKKSKDPAVLLRIDEIKAELGCATDKIDKKTGLVKTKAHGLKYQLAQARERLKIENEEAIKTHNADIEAQLTAVWAASVFKTPNSHSAKLLDKNFKTASKRAKADRKMLKVHRFDGTGQLGFDYSSEKNVPTVNDLFTPNNTFWIEPELMTSHPKEKRHRAHIHVSTGEFVLPVVLPQYKLSLNRTPSEFDNLWREANAAGSILPFGSTIQQVKINRTKLNGIPTWKIDLTYRHPIAETVHFTVFRWLHDHHAGYSCECIEGKREYCV